MAAFQLSSPEIRVPFREKEVRLRSGGVFKFDAASEDNRIVVCISTSEARTSSNNFATGKFMKLRSDMLYLLLCIEAQKRIILLTEKSMLDACLRQKQLGRVPEEIEFMQSDIPGDLRLKLVAARKKASQEVTPEKIEQLPDEILLSDGLEK